MTQVSFFRGAEVGFLMQIALRARVIVFSPGELIAPGFLYIVHRGVCAFYGKLLGHGKVWGGACTGRSRGLRALRHARKPRARVRPLVEQRT